MSFQSGSQKSNQKWKNKMFFCGRALSVELDSVIVGGCQLLMPIESWKVRGCHLDLNPGTKDKDAWLLCVFPLLNLVVTAESRAGRTSSWDCIQAWWLDVCLLPAFPLLLVDPDRFSECPCPTLFGEHWKFKYTMNVDWCIMSCSVF